MPGCATACSWLPGEFSKRFDHDRRGERGRAVVQWLDRAAIGRGELPSAIVGLSREQAFDRAIQRLAARIEIQKGEGAECRLEIVAPRAVRVLGCQNRVSKFSHAGLETFHVA